MKKGNVLNNEKKNAAVNTFMCGGTGNLLNCRC